MSMLEDIQTMDPFSVIICSPLLRVQVTTGKLPPLISYFMLMPLLMMSVHISIPLFAREVYHYADIITMQGLIKQTVLPDALSDPCDPY